MPAETRVSALRESTLACPSCRRLQHAADQRWVEMQDLRARLIGFENVLSEFVWLVSETAANELDQQEWNARLDEARERAHGLLQAPGVS